MHVSAARRTKASLLERGVGRGQERQPPVRVMHTLMILRNTMHYMNCKGCGDGYFCVNRAEPELDVVDRSVVWQARRDEKLELLRAARLRAQEESERAEAEEYTFRPFKAPGAPHSPARRRRRTGSPILKRLLSSPAARSAWAGSGKQALGTPTRPILKSVLKLPGGGPKDEDTPAVTRLPDGWETAVSRSTGQQYYVHVETGESTYDRPTANPVVSKPLGGRAIALGGRAIALGASIGAASLGGLLSGLDDEDDEDDEDDGATEIYTSSLPTPPRMSGASGSGERASVPLVCLVVLPVRCTLFVVYGIQRWEPAVCGCRTPSILAVYP